MPTEIIISEDTVWTSLNQIEDAEVIVLEGVTLTLTDGFSARGTSFRIFGDFSSNGSEGQSVDLLGGYFTAENGAGIAINNTYFSGNIFNTRETSDILVQNSHFDKVRSIEISASSTFISNIFEQSGFILVNGVYSVESKPLIIEENEFYFQDGIFFDHPFGGVSESVLTGSYNNNAFYLANGQFAFWQDVARNPVDTPEIIEVSGSYFGIDPRASANEFIIDSDLGIFYPIDVQLVNNQSTFEPSLFIQESGMPALSGRNVASPAEMIADVFNSVTGLDGVFPYLDPSDQRLPVIEGSLGSIKFYMTTYRRDSFQGETASLEVIFEEGIEAYISSGTVSNNDLQIYVEGDGDNLGRGRYVTYVDVTIEANNDFFEGSEFGDINLTLFDDYFWGGEFTTSFNISIEDGPEPIVDGLILSATGVDGSGQLVGSANNDSISGLDGDDNLLGLGGYDHLDGGAGIDIATYSGNQSSYSLVLSASSVVLQDRMRDRNDMDKLVDIEFLDFDTDLTGSPFDLQEFGGTTGLAAQDFESFIELYIAYFNRAPDAVGLNFWGTAFANGVTFEQMATLFVDQVETRATYPEGTSNTDFVTAVYGNVLGRIPDQAGFDFWVDMLNRSDVTGVTRDQFILEVLRGVQDGSTDRAYLDTKVDIGAYFAVHRGMSDTDNASAAMALFDGTQGSVNAAVAAIDGYYQDALDPSNGEFLMQVVGVLDNPFA